MLDTLCKNVNKQLLEPSDLNTSCKTTEPNAHICARFKYELCAHPSVCLPTHTCRHFYIMRASSHATLSCTVARRSIVRLIVHLKLTCVYMHHSYFQEASEGGFDLVLHNSSKLLNVYGLFRVGDTNLLEPPPFLTTYK